MLTDASRFRFESGALRAPRRTLSVGVSLSRATARFTYEARREAGFGVQFGVIRRLASDDSRPTGRHTRAVLAPHPARHLLRAKDLVDARYRDPLDVKTLARAAKLSPAHFSREFRREFGESPHQYLLMRRLERAASLLRTTDRSVADICLTVGLRSVGSFTTSFRRRFGMTPTEYRAAHPPAALRVRIPTCVQLAWARPETARLEKTAG